MRRLALALAGLCAALAAIPAGAGAQSLSGVAVAPPQAVTHGYATRVVPITQGGSLTFANFDLLAHTLTSVAYDGQGLPSFGSDFANFGETKPVRGVEQLAPGQYDFICLFHTNLRGTLVVAPRAVNTQGGTR